tara:strand:+ start:996 stop:1232 length:237 start_codon:yes stop_codon:yes gene_type:complete
MNVYILYISVLVIFVFVIFIAARAIYKNRYENRSLDQNENIKNNADVVVELQKLSDLYKSGSISEEEFIKAKKKVLNN